MSLKTVDNLKTDDIDSNKKIKIRGMFHNSAIYSIVTCLSETGYVMVISRHGSISNKSFWQKLCGTNVHDIFVNSLAVNCSEMSSDQITNQTSFCDL